MEITGSVTGKDYLLWYVCLVGLPISSVTTYITGTLPRRTKYDASDFD